MKLSTSNDFIQKLNKLESKREAKRMAKLASNPKPSRDTNNFHYKKGMSISKAAMIEMAEIKQSKGRKHAIAASPDLTQMVEVRIDARTSVFVTSNKNPDEVRKAYLQRHKMLLS